MEKYRQFADGGTGVNPFTPPWSNHKSWLVTRGLRCLALLPAAALKLLLLALALLWLALAELLCALIPLGFIRYPLYQLLVAPGCRLALLALGVLPAGEALADHRRLMIPPSKSSGAQVFNASHGTIVLANQQGLTDVLYLGLRLRPTFVFVASDGTPMQYGLLGALRRSATAAPPPPPAEPVPLAALATAAHLNWRGPVVVFPEGANTNGSCVLAWKAKTFEGVLSLEKPAGVAVISLEYSKSGAYTPQHTVGTAFRHIFWLCFQPWHTVRSTWLPPAEATAAIKGKAPAEQWALLRKVLTRMIAGAVEVEVTAERHAEFAAYWDASQRKGYTRPPPKQAAGTKKRS